MSFSMNEVAGMGKIAARGAGYDWGPAEEAGKAVRWLSERGVDGSAALAGVLARVEGRAMAALSPQITGGVWAAPGGTLCPIAAGMALSDRAGEIAGAPPRLHDVPEPVLLLPFLAACALHAGCTLRMAFGQAVAATDGRDLWLTDDLPREAALVMLTRGGGTGAARSCTSRAHPAPEAWETLLRFAQRTSAPATEASRLKGAGAGLSDND